MSDTGFERCYKWPVRAWWLVVVAAPLLLLVLLLARPSIDGTWENHPAHFWLVLGAAALATALGWAVNVAARRRREDFDRAQQLGSGFAALPREHK